MPLIVQWKCCIFEYLCSDVHTSDFISHWWGCDKITKSSDPHFAELWRYKIDVYLQVDQIPKDVSH